ncbi:MULTISPECIES: hypothetical protein [Rhodopseudomonas]|uniref:Uncharacterized protein n=1 Tax=Rhodopseudomonas palustris TaxID=1076 RepID=A0A0D7F772_RHOPL|nr:MULTISPECIES: hypothetical protein [Rhodopseudomonas]KIZ47567.1 hypothetical protein OO17_03655 [Rhodopseudomonas palustris]MDF3813099.1 hypothetical protein [Rhodopseudomonas sp. BAL398]WOK19279.1 hypothetical protein RBJ75_07110 [Rhodopseudomonas sp. BAL398]
MNNRTAKFAAWAVVAAGVALPAITAAPALAADECLAKPNAPAPQGSHWYYRTDRTQNRKCWYVRGIDEKPAAIPTASAEPAAPEPAATQPVLHPGVANARAEFAQDAVTPAPAPENAPVAQPAESPFPNPAVALNAEPQVQPAAAWPDRRDTLSSADRDPGASTATQTAVQAAPAAVAAETPAETAAGSSIRMLLGALVTALAVAGLAIGAIVKFGGTRPKVRRDANGRPDIWGDAFPAAPSPDARSEPQMQWIKVARQREEVLDQSNEIERLLSGAAKRSG